MDLEALKTIENGNKAVSAFSKGEMVRRQDGLRAIMADHRIDACLLTSIHNINYLADFLYCSFGRAYGLVVTDQAVTSISANIDGGQPWRRTVGGNLVYTDWERDNFLKATARLIGSGKRIGVEFDHLTLAMKSRLEAALPGVELIDVAAPLMRFRMVKSDEEITLIKQGAAIADLGGAACADAIRPGISEGEVALASTQTMVRAIAKRFPHAELMDTWTWFQSGINTDGAHNPVTSRALVKGDILSLNCFPMIAGYYTALERTLFLDHASDAHLKYWEINCAVHRRGLELIRPGVRCMDIARELNEIYHAHGILDRRTFGYGHSFGVLSHYYGREAGLELREDIDTVIEPNMVISMEPMIMIPEGEPGAGGYREHDILVTGRDGATNITGFAYGPEHNIIPS